MSTEHVEHREGFYRVAGTRVSLDSIVYAFLSGQSAESIAQSFPVLKLEARGREEANAGCPLMRIRFQADADLNQAIDRPASVSRRPAAERS